MRDADAFMKAYIAEQKALEEAEQKAQQEWLSNPNITLATPEEVAANLAEEFGQPTLPPAKEAELTRQAQWTKKQYVIFATPWFCFSLQGIKRLTSLDSLTVTEAFEQAGFRRYPYKSLNAGPALLEEMEKLAQEAIENKTKLYSDKPWHASFIGKLLATDIDLYKERVASRSTVEATIKEYLTDAREYVKSMGFDSLASAQRALDTKKGVITSISLSSMQDIMNEL